MMKHLTRKTIQTVNFTAGFALLVMLSPHHGIPCEKPAGIRAAIEVFNKRIALHAVPVQFAAAE